MNAIDRMLAEHECAALVNRFANLNDAMRYEELAALFTEGGRFARPTDPDNYVEGRDAILASFQARPRDRVSRHVISNIEVEVLDAERARGTCYAVLYTGVPDRPAEKFGLQANASQFIGEFYDEFEKTEEGWRISSRTGKIIFTT